MATFVDTSTEDDQILTLVTYCTNLKKKKEPEGDAATQFSNECTRLVQETRTRDVVLKLISEIDSIFTDQSDKGIFHFKISFYYYYYYYCFFFYISNFNYLFFLINVS